MALVPKDWDFSFNLVDCNSFFNLPNGLRFTFWILFLFTTGYHDEKKTGKKPHKIQYSSY